MTPAEAQAVRASRATPHARAWLATTTKAVALHVFDAAIYARNQAGDVIAITSETIGTGPLSLTVQAPSVPWTRLVAAGAPVETTGATLRIGRLDIDLSAAEDWDPVPAWTQLVSHPERLAPRQGKLEDFVLRVAPAGSLVSLLHNQMPEGLPDTALAVHRMARQAVPVLLEGLSRIEKGYVQVEAAAQRLAGLGGGFTPAGDDFLMGVIYALWSRLAREPALAAGRVIADAAAPRTTTVSAAYLRAAAAGAAGDGWHDLVDALVGGDDRSIEAAVTQLARIGHTSGADALAGYVTGLEAFRT